MLDAVQVGCAIGNVQMRTHLQKIVAGQSNEVRNEEHRYK